MTNEQTPHEVIANSLAMSYGSQLTPHTRDVDAAYSAVAALNAAEFAIVRKPTGDAIDVAIEVYAGDFTGGRRAAMAAALAAAAAADRNWASEDQVHAPEYDETKGQPDPADAAECTCGRAWEGHPQPHSIICRAYPAASAADKEVDR